MQILPGKGREINQSIQFSAQRQRLVFDRLCQTEFKRPGRKTQNRQFDRKNYRDQILDRFVEHCNQFRKQSLIFQEGVVSFSTPQRNLVFQALDEAEGRTAGYYCIPPFRWERLRYDLLTQGDHGWEPLPDPMLARVRCLQRVHARSPFDFYRIELNDRSILAAAERENLLKDLYPFLVYILTHEMVHMVRLSSILDNWSGAPVDCDETEEHRVQGISRRILTGSSAIRQVLDRFCS